MRRLLGALAGGTVLLLALAWPAAATDHAVAMKDDVFDPVSITIAPGDSVTWTNTGDHTHTVTADDGSYDSTNRIKTQTFTHTYGTPGSYPYYCKIHGGPGGAGMHGTVVVSAPATTTTTAKPTTTTVVPTTTTSTTAKPTTTTSSTTTSSTTTTSINFNLGTTSTQAPATTSTTELAAAPTASTTPDVGGPGALAAILLFATAASTALVLRKSPGR